MFDAKKFRSILAQKRLSFTEISIKTGIDPANISRYSNGKRNPNLRTIGKLAEAIEINPIELIK